jgi:hypothetical protein
MEIRLFLDNGQHCLGLKGKYIDDSGLRKEQRVKEGEVNVPDADWPRFTWGNLKSRLPGWPQTADSG